MQHRLKQRFDLEIVTHEPKIPYRETITADGGGRLPAQEAVRRPRAVRRGAPARLPAAARDQDAGAAARSSSPTRAEVREAAAASTTTRSTTSPSSTTSSAARSRTSSSRPSRRAARSCSSSGALAGYRMQDVAVEVHFGKDHTSTARKPRSRPPAAWRSRRRSWRPGRCCWSRS